MSTPAYDVDYFISKFEAILEEKWVEHALSWGGRCCALGHCQGALERDALKEVMLSLVHDGHGILVAPAAINDGLDPRYPQPTPKARILAALRDVKEGKA